VVLGGGGAGLVVVTLPPAIAFGGHGSCAGVPINTQLWPGISRCEGVI